MSDNINKQSHDIFKCKFCSQPMFPYYGQDKKIEGYLCGCPKFVKYNLASKQLQDLENLYKTRKKEITEELNELVTSSDFYKKVVSLIEINNKADNEKTEIKQGKKLVDLTKFIEANQAHLTLEKELEEYYWFPRF